MITIKIVRCLRDVTIWFEPGKLYLTSPHRKHDVTRVYATAMTDITLPSNPHFDTVNPNQHFQPVATFRVQSYSDLAQIRSLPVELVLKTLNQRLDTLLQYDPKTKKIKKPMNMYPRYFPELTETTDT